MRCAWPRALPPTWERDVRIAHLSLTAPVPARFWKRFAKCLANAPPWVRARGAHCKTVCTRSVSNPFALPLARGRRGAPPMDSLRVARRRPLPEGSPPMDSLRFAFGPCAAVLPCAPRARTKGRAMLRTRLSASKDAPATGKGEKGLRESLHLSPPKAKQSLVKGTREAPPCAKEPQTNSGRACTGPRPIRPRKGSRP